MTGYEWRAHITPDFPQLGHRLLLGRPHPEALELIIGFDDTGVPILTRLDPDAVRTFPGFLLPDDALQAIAEAVKPGPAQAEIARLEANLDHERQRVDTITNQLLDYAAPPPTGSAR